MNDDRAAARARNEALRDQVGQLLHTYEQQRKDLVAAQERFAATQVTAWSSDNLVRVVSNAAGIPIEVTLEPEAFKRSTPANLSHSITEAVQDAARQAVAASERAFASVETAADDIPDLSDLVPGAPSLRELVDSLIPIPVSQQQAEPEPQPVERDARDLEEDEDDYYRNRSYLEDRR
ncbi:YbaB/EbfC family nucleoid-associated protein [Nocardia donostiensis]|uniref:YbaB/EbfC family DNA-binding protein n=1 Tax=Nocardia donostiensis TaxID=1538463 RepID=A0A1W0B8K4_9NOCA|nr:YbaB/EbfC family nucleoid-associated protein [Nocardia donostiensis]ONM50423.1 hypothetical protein B0T46_00365 [Nocardia donostiensis]OQS17342.1 hypothetical protein B0T36_01795 [Nocardia donostiensis]OQS18726.1 hypothetical protein B0T44_18030 [Nocardia donostiensis]